MSFPEVPAPASVKVTIDLKLKPDWRFDQRRRRFQNDSGETFSPSRDLPKGAKTVHKVPRLAGADIATLSDTEKDLRRYLQVILPAGESPEKYLAAVRGWPCTAEAHTGPQASLPELAQP